MYQGLPSGGSATDAGGRPAGGDPFWGHARDPEGPGWRTWGQGPRAGPTREEALKKRGGVEQRKRLRGRLVSLDNRQGCASACVSSVKIVIKYLDMSLRSKQLSSILMFCSSQNLHQEPSYVSTVKDNQLPQKIIGQI